MQTFLKSAHGKLMTGVLLGLILGLASAQILPGSPAVAWATANLIEPAGKLFLRLLFMLVVPLLFAALVSGVNELDTRQLGRLGLRMLAYTVVVSAIAVVIGLVLVNVLQPGAGMESIRDRLLHGATGVQSAPPPPDASPAALLVAMVPDNPIKAAASGDMLGWLVFALLFGIALARTSTPAASALRESIAGLNDVLTTLINGVLKLAPIGVGALLFTLGNRLGLELLRSLAAYVGVVLLGLGLHLVVVYSVSLQLIARRSPWQFFKDIRLAMVTAFSTASSSATLPTAIKVADENLKLPTQVSRFVLTAGSAMNQNGTALFEGVTVLFLAQLYGVHLSLSQQAMVMVVCVLGGIGTAGVPAGSLPVIAMICGTLGIPPEGLGLILGVDRFLDMCRTTINVTGDLVAAACLAPVTSSEPGSPVASSEPG